MSVQLLTAGIYSIAEAARLVNIHPARLRAWICGHSDGSMRPLIKRDLPIIDHQIALSFVNLIEARFIAAFARYGISIQSIRVMAEEAERYFGEPHPFAKSAMFKTDGQKIYLASGKRTKDPKMYDLKTRNYAMPQVLSEGLKNDVEFAVGGLANVWYPRKAVAPSVTVSARVAFGKPVLKASGVPTIAITDALAAEDNDFGNVARWFGLTVDQVKQAQRFEVSIKGARTVH